MRWPEGVRVGARVIASTQMGFWIRGVVRRIDPSGAFVAFDQGEASDWLPRLRGFGSTHETVTPERIALLPEAAPSVLPPASAPVIVLWNGKRFHPATLVAREHASAGVVRYDEGDEEPVTPGVVLARGSADASAADALRAAGLVEGAAVRVKHGGSSGWVSEVGSGVVYVRYPKASHGHWCRPADLTLGGGARPRRASEERRSVAELAPGARVSARWVDRVRYPGIVRALRGDRSEAEIVWDDGSIEWVRARRIIVTAAAPPAVPQARAVEAIDVRGWTSGAEALVRTQSGDWVEARVEAVRGDDAYLSHGHRGRTWARGRDLAAAPTPERFPARGTAVVLEERARAGGKATYRTGRVADAAGGRVEVRLDAGGKTMVGPEVLWRRVGPPAAPSGVPSGVTAGARVLVEHRPDDLVRARVVKVRAPEGLARVELESGAAATVDLARVRWVEEPPAPPPPPPVVPVIEPAPPPSADERARRVAKLVALAWTGGGYRASAGEGGRVALEVEVGELTLDVRIEHDELFVVEITAAGAVPGAPPIDGAAVRLARFLRSLVGGRAEDTPAIEAEDHTWAKTLARRGVRREVARAGGALTVVLRADEEPGVAEVVGWARAVHARLFDPA